jgi:hypothetical protein
MFYCEDGAMLKYECGKNIICTKLSNTTKKLCYELMVAIVTDYNIDKNETIDIVINYVYLETQDTGLEMLPIEIKNKKVNKKINKLALKIYEQLDKEGLTTWSNRQNKTYMCRYWLAKEGLDDLKKYLREVHFV